MKQYTIKVTVMYQTPFWVGIFERVSETNYEVARNVFGAEPTDAELYDCILHDLVIKLPKIKHF